MLIKIENGNIKPKDSKSALFLSVLPLEDSRERSDWIGYILLKLNIKNIKYYKKIIFKRVNSIIKFIFNKKINEK